MNGIVEVKVWDSAERKLVPGVVTEHLQGFDTLLYTTASSMRAQQIFWLMGCLYFRTEHYDIYQVLLQH